MVRSLAATASVAAALCAPALAGAATVAHDPAAPGVTYTAVDGEANQLSVTGSAASVGFGDSAGIAAPVAPDLCQAADAFNVTCPLAPVAIGLGDGSDTLSVGAGAPAMAIQAGSGDDALVDPALSGGTVFNGGDGIDRVDYSGRSSGVTVSLGFGSNDGEGAEADHITAEDVAGGAGSDAITGTGSANGLTGGAGSDILTGGGGDDILDGGANGDTLLGQAGVDSLVGGPGIDTLHGGTGDDTISADDRQVDTVDCGPGTDTVVADRGADGVTDRLTGCENVSGPTAPVAGSKPEVRVAGLVTVRAPGAADPSDLTPPTASLRAAIRQKVKTVRARGVALRIACDEACGISAALALARPAAKRLGLARSTGGAVLGARRARRATPGIVHMRVRLSAKARTALRKARRVTITAQALVSDASGNGTLLQRRVTLVR
jgi:Ca2+-binding RTX toxin-like protein